MSEEVVQKYYKDDEVILTENLIPEMIFKFDISDDEKKELVENLKKVDKFKILSYGGQVNNMNLYQMTYVDVSSVEDINKFIIEGLYIYETAIKEKAEKVDKIVAGAFDLRQKTWGIFLNIYEEDRRIDEYYPIRTKEFRFQDSACNGRYVNMHVLGKLCILQETTTSFVYLRERIKYYMDKFGYSKDDIIVGEILPMDHKVTPLK